MYKDWSIDFNAGIFTYKNSSVLSLQVKRLRIYTYHWALDSIKFYCHSCIMIIGRKLFLE